MMGVLAQITDSAASGAIAGAMVSAVVLLAKLLPWPNRKNGENNAISTMRDQLQRVEVLLHETREGVVRLETAFGGVKQEVERLPCVRKCPSEYSA